MSMSNWLRMSNWLLLAFVMLINVAQGAPKEARGVRLNNPFQKIAQGNKIVQGEQTDVKVYALYTPSHRVFLRDWFLPSITQHDDFTLIIRYAGQDCDSGEFMMEGWNATMLKKVKLVIEGIRENPDEVFIHSDVDIQFFAPFKDLILSLMKDKDMLFQKDHDETGSKSICAGFFACRGTPSTLKLWARIYSDLKAISDSQSKENDQTLLRKYLGSNEFKISWGLLPDSFFGGGTFTNTRWKPGVVVPIPDRPIMHHANWTIGIPNKIGQLQHVKESVDRLTKE